MLPGYHGSYLHIDVSTGRAEKVPLSETLLRQYHRWQRSRTRLLLDTGGATIDALSPDAPLIFAFSPLVGTPLTTSAKFAVVSRSPLTERINDSLAGSGFALAGKRCGCDAIVIVGRAERLSLLVIDDGDVQLRPASQWRGVSSAETEEEVRGMLGAEYRIASIGPAGERLVRYATISHDRRHAGRGGSGAVLGSKNIKAIAVRGSRHGKWAHAHEPRRVEPGPVAAIVRPRDREVPRIGNGGKFIDAQSVRCLADAEFSERHLRWSRTAFP
jgi:aldehyde:ferredoxin oxidoreductase